MVDVLVLLMFWCSQCFGAIDVLVRSIFWCSMFWCDRCFGAGQCFGAVDVLVWSMFWIGQSFVRLTRAEGSKNYSYILGIALNQCRIDTEDNYLH